MNVFLGAFEEPLKRMVKCITIREGRDGLRHYNNVGNPVSMGLTGSGALNILWLPVPIARIGEVENASRRAGAFEPQWLPVFGSPSFPIDDLNDD